MPIAFPLITDLVQAFVTHENQRTYARAELKERRMSRLLQTPGGFFRGTAALFYALLHEHPSAPALFANGQSIAVVGDVHLENIGVFATKPGKYLVNFNDYDEAAWAHPLTDVIRAIASAVLCGLDQWPGVIVPLQAAKALLSGYLRGDKTDRRPDFVEKMAENAEKNAMDTVLSERCPLVGGVRKFTLGKRYLPLKDDEESVARELFARWNEQQSLSWVQKKLNLEDVVFRVQGTGSLGVRRFVFVAREGKKDQWLIVEAKEIRQSALRFAPLAGYQPSQVSEAERVKSAITALLGELPEGTLALTGSDQQSYLLRVYSPSENKITLEEHVKTQEQLLTLCRYVGRKLAHAHQRAGMTTPLLFDETAVLSVAIDLASVMARVYQQLKLPTIES